MKNQFKSGLDFENKVERLLLGVGYLKTNQNRFNQFRESYTPVFCRQYKGGKTVFARDMISDFMVYHPEKHSKCVKIECKFQGSKGTAMDKLPKFISDVRENAPQSFILLLGGNGFIKGVYDYLYEQQQHTPNLIGVVTLGELKRLI